MSFNTIMSWGQPSPQNKVFFPKSLWKQAILLHGTAQPKIFYYKRSLAGAREETSREAQTCPAMQMDSGLGVEGAKLMKKKTAEAGLQKEVTGR
jgi:hypothetical protein